MKIMYEISYLNIFYIIDWIKYTEKGFWIYDGKYCLNLDIYKSRSRIDK